MPLPTRRVRFAYPEDLRAGVEPAAPRVRVRGQQRVADHAARRAVLRAGRPGPRCPQLDPTQRAEAEAYIRQEAQHHAQHRRFNDLLVARCPGLARLERWMARAYGWVERRHSLRFNLAFAAASETIAYSLARWTERRSGDLFDGAEPVPTSLFLWHLAEEVEHKSAAFDVWKAVDGTRRRYVLGRRHLARAARRRSRGSARW